MDIVELMEKIKRSYWDAVMVEHKVNHVYRLPKRAYRETCERLTLMADAILNGAKSEQEWEQFCIKNHGFCLECREWIQEQYNFHISQRFRDGWKIIKSSEGER